MIFDYHWPEDEKDDIMVKFNNGDYIIRVSAFRESIGKFHCYNIAKIRNVLIEERVYILDRPIYKSQTVINRWGINYVDTHYKKITNKDLKWIKILYENI